MLMMPLHLPEFQSFGQRQRQNRVHPCPLYATAFVALQPAEPRKGGSDLECSVAHINLVIGGWITKLIDLFSTPRSCITTPRSNNSHCNQLD
jgi:hypothetical protein